MERIKAVLKVIWDSLKYLVSQVRVLLGKMFGSPVASALTVSVVFLLVEVVKSENPIRLGLNILLSALLVVAVVKPK